MLHGLYSREEIVMESADAMVLIGIIAVFISFALVLAWVSRGH